MPVINGEKVDAAVGKSISEYLAEAGFDAHRVAVELNLEIVPAAAFGTTRLSESDSMEIVQFVQGG